MRTLLCLAAMSLLTACAAADTDVRSAAASMESCADYAARMAPFNPQTARTIEADCLRRHAGR